MSNLKLYNESEVAELLRVSLSTLRRWRCLPVEQRPIQHIKATPTPKGRVVYEESALDLFIATRRAATEKQGEEL